MTCKAFRSIHHSCDQEVRHQMGQSMSRAVEGQKFYCSCGKVYVYVEDEAEGGGWVEKQKQKRSKA